MSFFFPSNLQLLQHYAFFLSNFIWFQCVSWFFFCPCICVFGYFFPSLLLDLCCVLEFPVFPTISHGKSKDGIQPFKGPKPAARIANSLENRVYWAACRGWHTPVPCTFPSLPSPPSPNQQRICYPEPTTRGRLSTPKNSRRNKAQKFKKNTNQKKKKNTK